MIFISDKKMLGIIAKRISEETPSPQKTNLLRVWKKAATPITVAFVILFVIYTMIFKDEFVELCLLLTKLLFHVEAPGKLLGVTAVLISYAIYFCLYVIIHELIHLIFSVDRQKAAIYFIHALPKSVSVFYDAWLTKTKELLCVIAPTVVLSVLIVPFFWISSPVYAGLLLILHLISCSSDIFAFFYLNKTLPANCLVYGHYYKTESLKTEDSSLSG